MLPDNIKKYLNDLFTAIGFETKEVAKKIASLNSSFEIILLDKIFKNTSKEDRDKISEKLKKAKDIDEAVKIVSGTACAQINQLNFKEIYLNELNKLLNKILKPFTDICTPEQLVKLKELTNKYIKT